MHKVMTRAQQRPATRPPARRDPRRPGGSTGARTPGGTTPRTTGSPTPHAAGGTAPPRTPGGGPARTPAADGPPPGSARAANPHTRPTDTRPPTPSATPTAPGRATRTTARASRTTTPPTRASRTTTPVPASPGTAPRGTQHPHRPVPVPHLLPTDLFADLLLAVLSGHRPVHSMLRHTRGRAYDELAWLAERGPLRTRGARPVVRDIGYFEPRPGAIEAFARIGAGDRLRAMAFRLELGQDLRWRCTAVELGGPRPPRAEAD
ncbi:Rv3235 family protein [Streptomyces afghaniensis]|uniref:Rv3235 family protein n=1 Tax=Streptomyces afghaniensis TaxID=66865 RepID=UPI0027D80A4F|nr:Rv3235 family protein [Streptomyces afghaniensis]